MRGVAQGSSRVLQCSVILSVVAGVEDGPSHLVAVLPGRDCPSGRVGAQAEHGEAGEVVCGGEQVEVGGDLRRAAHSGAAAAVPAAHQVSDLAFHLGAGGSVVSLPVRVALAGPGPGELFFVGADIDGAASLGPGALPAASGQDAQACPK